MSLLKQGFSKHEILEKTECSVGVNNANLEVYKGEFFVVMGLSGSGKSTLLRCLNRLIEPTSGDIFINDINITKKSHSQLLETRRKEITMVFQNFGLLPHRNVIDNVIFGLEIRGENKEERYKKAETALETVGLQGYENVYPDELSGGMRQRVGLARALANDAEILLMDEAFSALDPLIRSDMQDELISLQNKLKKTIVFITHDLDEAIKLGDRIAIMKDGIIEQIGTAEDILTQPASDYVKAFVEKVDRKAIITAESLMFEKPTVAIFKKDGPEGSIRKMRNAGLDKLPVVDTERIFMGYIFLNDVLRIEKDGHHTVEEIIKTDVHTVAPTTTVEEMLPLISENGLPVTVTHSESNKFLGIISQTSLIIESTRFNKSEILEMKKQALA